MARSTNGWDERPDGTSHRLVGKNGLNTQANPHVHLIKDFNKREVRLHLTENTQTQPVHSGHMVLPITATKAEVDRAVDSLLKELNDPRRVSLFSAAL